jgi:hypothetical protein
MHVDSSIYVTIAEGITRGQLPYMDFVDNKGPLLYFLSVPGLLLGKFTGIWITELLLMFTSVLFAYKTALFFAQKYMALFGTACVFIAFLAFFTVAAGTEEYSLPFLMISLYIFTKYYFLPEKNIRMVELIVLGICFACAVLIRLNMFPLWAGFCVVIIVESAAQKRFALLGKYILGFCLGIAVVIIPVFLYLKLNKILAGFFDQVVFAGAARGFAGGSIKQTAKNYYVVINRAYSFLPLLTGFFWCITKYKKSNFNFYVGYTFSYFLMVLFLSFSSGDSHYNMVLIPFYVPAFVFIAKIVYSAFSEVKHKNILLAIFFCVVLSEGLAKYIDDATEIFYNNSGSELFAAGKIIDDNTRHEDKIISLGFNGYIYPFTKRQAVSKFFFQGSGVDNIPKARREFLSDISQNKPAIITIFTGEEGRRYDYLPGWYSPVYEMIAREYELLSDENGFVIFKRSESAN